MHALMYIVCSMYDGSSSGGSGGGSSSGGSDSSGSGDGSSIGSDGNSGSSTGGDSGSSCSGGYSDGKHLRLLNSLRKSNQSVLDKVDAIHPITCKSGKGYCIEKCICTIHCMYVIESYHLK